jgi:hypothetical protein
LLELCAGTRKDGSPCSQTVEPPQRFCWWHDPQLAEKRSRASARGGRARPNRALSAIKEQLQSLADAVIAGEQDRAAAAVAGQLLNIKLRCLELERRFFETDELERRIQHLEREQEQGDLRGSRWG